MKRLALLIVCGLMFTTSIANAQATFNLTTGTGTGTGWTWSNSILTVNNNTSITITGSVSNGRRIEIAYNAVGVNITLEDVTVEGLLGNNPSALLLNDGAMVTLNLVGDNRLITNAWTRAGIEAPHGTTLMIEGTGSLFVNGGIGGGAGIGGSSNQAGGNITINGGVITALGGVGAGIGGGQNGDGGNITINAGEIIAIGGTAAAGIGGGHQGDGGNITINGGVVIAGNPPINGIFSSGFGAGIGGGRWGDGGKITINCGIVTATGSSQGAGIGGGENGAGGYVVINGGEVTALAIEQGVGRGSSSGAVGTFTMNGNAVVFTNSIGDTDVSRRTGGILFIGNNGTFHGNSVTISTNVTIPIGHALTIPSGATLTIPYSITLTNNGGVGNCGTINMRGVFGEWMGNEPIVGSNYNTIDMSLENPTPPCDGSWTFANNIYRIHDGANITITGTSSKERRIEIVAGARVTITLEYVTIEGLDWNQSPLLLNAGANVTLMLAGTNTLTATGWSAGIQAPEGTTLTICGTGSLTATGGINGSGIGGGVFLHMGGGAAQGGGNIAINGGVVRAIGGNNPAQGIGRGSNSNVSAGTFTMNGNAVVFANSIGDTDVSRRTNGILFIGNIGMVHGAVILPSNLTIVATQTLTIPESAVLTNNNILAVAGTLMVASGGTLINNKDITLVENGNIIGIDIVAIAIQPANTAVPFGDITENLTVEVSVIVTNIPQFQWYSNTSNSNTDGTPIGGETSTEFEIPVSLELGTHYFYVVLTFSGSSNEAILVRSNVAIVTVAHIVTFNSKGGSKIDPQMAITDGTIATEPDPPTRIEHTFQGWYTESEYINRWDFETDVVASSMTLYARWTNDKETVCKLRKELTKLVDSIVGLLDSIQKLNIANDALRVDTARLHDTIINLRQIIVEWIVITDDLFDTIDWLRQLLAECEIGGTSIVTDEQAMSIQVFPNPVTNKLHITMPPDLPTNTAVELFDMNGRRVYLAPHTSYIETEIIIDMSPFPAGTYILRIDNQTIRIIKQ